MTDGKNSRFKFAAVTLLNLGTFSWFFIFVFCFDDISAVLTPNTPGWGAIVGNSLFYGFTIFWAIAVSFIGGKINRRKLLFTSIILGIFSTILMAFLEGPFFASILISLMGTSLGLGMPSSMALVADYTVVDNRGRASGIIVLGTFIVAFASIGIYGMLGLGIFGLILILVAVRLISVFGLVSGKLGRALTVAEKKIRLPTAAYREFLFYLSPWVMFTIASSLARNLVTAGSLESGVDIVEGAYLGDRLRYVFIAVFGLAAGFMADRLGRKQPIILGIATFGIGYLLLGFSMGEMAVNIYYVLSGITWGLFFVVFLAVPGDLSTPILRERFYALGYILPVTALFAISTIPVENIGEHVGAALIAQIVGGCIFLSMYPVFRAKETLTEKKMRERKMKEYAERLGKTIQETEENQ